MKPHVFAGSMLVLLLATTQLLSPVGASPVSGIQDTLKYFGPANALNLSDQPDYVVHFIQTLEPMAVAEMNKYHIPASVILAQAILESGYGESLLAQQAFNYFGIKANRKEKVTYLYDGDAYRSYPDLQTCFEDHSKFLLEKPVIKNLVIRGNGLYTTWLYALDAICYAEDPEYVFKLRTIIERLELYRLDEWWVMIE